ncbi:MAG: hypothetical protein ABJZ79_00785, partial [Parasphingorhabdus sp.]|uniref:hypothetical protein n=1 Tax=Parasphingorhabdus sp. TaxID=2709688 RepID=UPI003296AA94
YLRGAISIPETPMEVTVGIELDQITSVDQKSENYGAVATIRMEWSDPKFAFDPAEAGGDVMVLEVDSYVDMARERSAIVPSFSIENQQGNRWIQNELVVISPEGSVRYLEKSSVTLQAPYFNFIRYPFDRQVFYYEVVSHFPATVVQFKPDNELSGLGSLLGEEEWILYNAEMVISEARGLSGQPSSKAALKFEGRRHTQYYLTRIFLPLLVLVAVSWSVFFLDGYRKRAEVAGANLLVFVAFNWVISDELPKLGYLTFLDFILQWMFVVTGLIVVFNVFLSRLKAKGREDVAITLDWYLFRWVYPIGYIGIVAFGIWYYLLRH